MLRYFSNDVEKLEIFMNIVKMQGLAEISSELTKYEEFWFFSIRKIFNEIKLQKLLKKFNNVIFVKKM
jgi:hypothetical protein